MDVTSVAIVVAALGVNFGWQPSKEDPQAYEVLLQVEPELVDVLHDGRQIPIESHVPASVTPIRNIRIIVGTDELPRTPIADKSDEKTQSERIVRGQEESPLEHTARFQGDDGWSGGLSAPTNSSSRQFDERGATIGVEPIRTAQAPPWTLGGAQQAASNAGNSLRDSVNSGGQQLLDSAQNAGRDFGQQLQNMTGLGGQSASPLAAPATSRSSRPGWSAPPPLAESVQSPPLAAPPSQSTTPATWSSIRPELAPPRLATPPMANGVRVASNPSAGRTSAGPSFPPPPTTSAPPLHSVLADPPTTSSRTTEPDWSSAWSAGSASNTASSDDDAGVGLVPVPPRPRTAATQPPMSAPAAVTANSSPAPASSPEGDRYSEPAAPAPAAANGADVWANFGQSQNSGLSNAPPQPQAPVAATLPIQSAPQQVPSNPPAIATQPPAAQPTPQAAGGEDVPWKPLLAVSLTLAGSLGANLFLGWSYADARHRYRSLVAKTTHSFQKAAGIAA